jgi:uridine kinase
VPLAYIALFFHSLTFRFFNRDVFVMFLGFSFGILTLLIPPMQGWYYWIIPFFIYFYAKNDAASKFGLWMLTAGYFLYFLVMPNSDFLHVFQYVSTSIGSMPSVYDLLQSNGINASIVSNITFTFLQTALLVNVLWIYSRGVEESKKSKLYNMPYLVGIAGDSGSGKSVFAGLLTNIFGAKNIAIVEGDDMHKWERGNEMWQKYTHLNPGANELHGNLEHALTLKSGGDVYRRHYDHDTGTFTFPNKLESKKIVVFEGLHSFYLAQMRKALDLKIFIMPDEQLRTHWKVCRDMKERGYTKAKVLEALQKRECDSNTFIKTQEEYSDITISLRSKEDISMRLGEDITPDIFLELKCSNDVNIDAFVQALSPFMSVDHFFSEQAQMLRVRGTLSSDDAKKVSYIFEPELCEVVITEPEWSADYNGVIELFVCYYIINSLKLHDHA